MINKEGSIRLTLDLNKCRLLCSGKHTINLSHKVVLLAKRCLMRTSCLDLERKGNKGDSTLWK